MRDQLSVRSAGEEARRDCLPNIAAMLEDLFDECFVLAVRVEPDRLGPVRAERRLVDLAYALVARAVGAVPLHHQHEALRLPAEPDELRFQALSMLVAADVDPSVADAGCALDAVGLGRELLGTCMVGLERTQEVEVVDAVQARMHEDR